LKNTERFSDRVSDYINFRPSYPSVIIDILRADCRLNNNSVIADIGSGTGKLTELLLKLKLTVHAVEPNKEMREAAVTLLGSNAHFVSVAGTAEATNLDDQSVDLITVAQAFHWFDLDNTKIEFERILKPNGHIALIWNERNTNLPFQKEYDQMLTEYAPEYSKVNHRNITDKDVSDFLQPRTVRNFSLPYSQKFDLAGLIGRMNSSSYTPKSDTPKSLALNTAATQLFKRHEVCGRIEFSYQSRVYLGSVSSGPTS